MIAKLCAILAVVLVIIVKELKDDEMRIEKLWKRLIKPGKKRLNIIKKSRSETNGFIIFSYCLYSYYWQLLVH